MTVEQTVSDALEQSVARLERVDQRYAQALNAQTRREVEARTRAEEI